MKNILKFEIKRAVQSKGFLISLLLSHILVIFDMLFYVKNNMREESYQIAIAAWLGTDFQFAYNPLFFVLLPIIAALPFAGSYYTDLQSGYIKNICIRVSRKDYYRAKYCATFLFGAISVMLPLLVSLMLSMAVYPMRRPEKLSFAAAPIIDASLFGGIFHQYPALYCILFTLLDGLLAGMVAMFSVCIAEHVESYFSAITTPFTVYVLSGVALSGNTYIGSLMEIVNPLQPFRIRWWQVAAYLLGGICISMLWIYLKGRRKDII